MGNACGLNEVCALRAEIHYGHRNFTQCGEMRASALGLALTVSTPRDASAIKANLIFRFYCVNVNEPQRSRRKLFSGLTQFLHWELFQLLETQVTPLDLGADQFLFTAYAVHLQANEAFGRKPILKVGTGNAVKPGLDGVAAALDTDLVPFVRLVDFLTSLGES